jgi:hypothetical protein
LKSFDAFYWIIFPHLFICETHNAS